MLMQQPYQVTIVDSGAAVLKGEAGRVQRAVHNTLEARGIHVMLRTRVGEIDEQGWLLCTQTVSDVCVALYPVRVLCHRLMLL